MVFGGTLNDTINPITVEQVKGKVLVVNAPAGGAFGRGGRGGRRGGPMSEKDSLVREATNSAAAVVTVAGESLNEFSVNGAMNTKTARPFSPAADAPPAPLSITVTNAAAEALLGVALRVGDQEAGREAAHRDAALPRPDAAGSQRDRDRDGQRPQAPR